MFKIIGWLVIPYIMLAIKWKKHNHFVKSVGGIWAVFVFIVTLAMVTPLK